MEPPRLGELRIFYNTTIRPELIRMERRRKRMLWGIFGSVALLLLIMLVFALVEAGFVVLYLLIPVLFYLSTLYFRIRNFKKIFKPAIVSLVLDFINQAPNFRQLSYRAEQMVAKDRFAYSELFVGRRVTYEGEDYIKGLVGEMPFELSELYVQEISRASNRLELIFGGIFIHAIFAEEASGHLVAWPRSRLRSLRPSIRAFIAQGGMDALIELQSERFRERFVVYAKPNTVVKDLLTLPMQRALADFVEESGREIHFAIHNRNVFVAIDQDRDLLEPNIFRSNLDFGLIREFYTDIVVMLSVIRDFDQTH